MTSLPRALALALLASLALALAGCGGGPPVPTKRYVYTSSNDCMEAKELTPEQCSTGIEQAIADHDTKATKYVTEYDCELKEGMGRCERFAERHYRPRLMGYLFVVNKTLVATPLYADTKKAAILVDAAGAAYDWQRTPDITFSQAAATKARGIAKPKKPRKI